MKPRLTQKALSGLGSLAGLVDAGGPAGIMGYDEEQFTDTERRGWDEIQAACRWIRAMQRHIGGPENVAEMSPVSGHSEPLAGPQTKEQDNG